jgi:hypothetical protein
MEWVVTAFGGVVVLVALRDIFHTCGTPAAAAASAGSSWRQCGTPEGQPWPREARCARRPMAMAVVVLAWVLFIVLGWALVYWPHLPDGFVYGSGIEAAERGEVIDALYLLIVTLATLGFGDIVPHDLWLRLAVPVQALVGFALLTAAVSWVLQVYPALTRRRALAIRLSLLSRSGTCRLLEREESSLAATILEDLTTEVVPARGRPDPVRRDVLLPGRR